MKRAPLLLLLLCACRHAAPAKSETAQAAPAPPPVDVLKVAAELSAEAHAFLRSEGELLWTRWTTGTGPMPTSALAQHPRLMQRDNAELVRAAAAKSAGTDAAALKLFAQQLTTQAAAHDAANEIEALDRARAQLIFAAAGDARPERGERDLDKLLSDEADAKKRAATALEEAKAAAALVPLAMTRDAAEEKALGSSSWASVIEAAHGMPVADLAALAEKTLTATEAVASQAVSEASVRNLGVTADRLRRADLPRLVRQAPADSEFVAGHAWPAAVQVLTAIGAQQASLKVDAEPSPSKGARPLALLIDPPQDVRLSLRPAGGIAEQRATLHEGARALGGVSTTQPRWELSQLGDGSASEGVALLFESLAGDPGWLREATALRGEPLDDLVHTEVTRRLLTARRAAAQVLFEIRRREGPRTAEAYSALYRGLAQRATFAVLSNEDAQRWTLQADAWLPAAPQLLGALLAAQLELSLRTPAGNAGASAALANATSVPPVQAKTAGTAVAIQWWKQPSPPILKIWQGGRSLTAAEAAQGLGLTSLDPSALAQIATERLSYQAPDAPPAKVKPDYKFMQGDKKRRRVKH
ncbi:MAG TPA: hypothetical protein VH083_17350, partial [Myxococcales bacterium]|nr:hypothetical protein [Myxococcales bacterium]